MSDRFTNGVLRDLLRRDPALRRRVGLTCIRKDGAGAQLHAAFSALVAAKILGVAYVHAPMRNVQHAVGDPALWARRWEAFFNIGCGERQLTPDDRVVDRARVPDHLQRWEGPFVVNAKHYLRLAYRKPAMMRSTAATLRSRYDAGDKPHIASHKAEAGLTVAVHIRKGDILKKAWHLHRLTADDQNVRAIETIRSALGDRLGVVNLYSQGSPEDFAAYLEAGCRLHLDTDAFETFDNLVTADILVMAKSSFSYMAGWLSNGVAIYEPYRHVPDRNWIIRDPDGGFDPRRLQRALEPPTALSRLADLLLRRR